MSAIGLINTILSKKHGTPVSIECDNIIMNPSDMRAYESHTNKGGTIDSFTEKYERFELRSKGKFYAHILKGTIDTSSDKVVIFEMDMDINNNIMVMGSPVSKKYNHGDYSGIVTRKIILDYSQIDSIEFTYFKEDEE